MEIPLLFGPYGSGALQHIEQFSCFGANALWFHGFDAQAFETCQQHGIHASVEFKTFRADFMQHPELIPIGVDGQPIRYGDLVQGVCLSNQAFLEETEQHLLEGITTYNPTGVWFDYLTYGGWFETPEPDLQESCFCPACIAEFCNAEGQDAASPQEILTHHQGAWTRHKCERVAAYANHYASLVRTHKPSTITGAYMCPWTPDEFGGALARIFAQDYALLAPSIDIFTPLIYNRKSGRSAAWGREFLEASPSFIPQEGKVQLILDVLDYPKSMLETAQSSIPTWGFQMFGGAEVFEDEEKAKVFKEAVEEIRERIVNSIN